MNIWKIKIADMGPVVLAKCVAVVLKFFLNYDMVLLTLESRNELPISLESVVMDKTYSPDRVESRNKNELVSR